MTEFLKKLTANRMVVSIICITLGLLCIIIPKSILPTVSLIFGIFLCIFGLYQLVNIVSVQNNGFIGFSIVACALSFLMGIVLILNQDAGTLMVGLITGIWALVAGIVHFSQAFILAKIKMPYADNLVQAVCELCVAILMFVNMNAMVAIQIIILGVLLVAYGIYVLVMHFYLLKTAKQLSEAHQEFTAKKNDENEEIIIEDNNENNN